MAQHIRVGKWTSDFARARETFGGGRVLARDVKKKPGYYQYAPVYGGHATALVTDEDKAAAEAAFISGKDAGLYEIVHESNPCVGYLVVETDTINQVLGLWEEYTLREPAFQRAVVLLSDDERRHHVIFPDTRFENNHLHLKRFVDGFAHFVREKKEEVTTIDLTVYRKNQRIRALNQASLRLISGVSKPWEWMVQPFGLRGKTDDAKILNHWYPAAVKRFTIADHVIVEYRGEEEGELSFEYPSRVAAGGTAVIERDADFLKYYRAADLRHDYDGIFVPFAKSLAATTGDELARWCGDDLPALEKDVWVPGEFALNRLRKDLPGEVRDLRDARAFQTPAIEFPLPKGKKWKAVNGPRLVKELCRGDEKKKIHVVSGQMGAGKSWAVRTAVAKNLLRGVWRSALILVPRPSSATYTAKAIKEILAVESRKRGTHPVETRLITTAAKKKKTEPDYLNWCSGKKRRRAELTVCEINSLFALRGKKFDCVVYEDPRIGGGRGVREIVSKSEHLIAVDAWFSAGMIADLTAMFYEGEEKGEKAARYCVYDAPAIFDAIVEYRSYRSVLDDIREARKRRESVAVYCSCPNQAAAIGKELDDGVMVIPFCAGVCTDGGNLGKDRVYAIVSLAEHNPSIEDMVHLFGRIRAVGDKTLRYHLQFGYRATPVPDSAKELIETLKRRRGFSAYDATSAAKKLAGIRYESFGRREFVKAVKRGFANAKTADLAYTYPAEKKQKIQ